MTHAGRTSILFISKDVEAASTRYRALAYFPYLRQAGWEPRHCAPQTLKEQAALLHQARRAEVVVVLRRRFSFPLLVLLRRASTRLIFDFDDAIFSRNDGSPSHRRMAGFSAMVRRCDQVFAGNEYLAKQARRFNPCVTVLPTAVEPEAYRPGAHDFSPHIDLVWVGSRSTESYVSDLIPVLERASAQNSRLRLKVIADFSVHTERIPALAVAWDRATEARHLAASHVGIAPMPENEWTLGKCGLKVLQYMAAGLPVVASAVGVHHDLVLHGKTGFLARTPEEWIDAVQRLAADAPLRKFMGDAGRKRVETSFSTAAMFKRMERELETLVKRTE